MTDNEIKAINHFRYVVNKEEYTNKDILFLTETNWISKNIKHNLEYYLKK